MKIKRFFQPFQLFKMVYSKEVTEAGLQAGMASLTQVKPVKWGRIVKNERLSPLCSSVSLWLWAL